MSRCFPYPPPGHLRNGVRGEAVRESIKLQRDRESTITELDKKKRKDKRERKEKKEKKKKKNAKEIKELFYDVDTYNQPQKSPLLKAKEEEAERSERSGLTEEHEQPVCSQSQCHSPDSTYSSNKRKKDEAGSIMKTHGNILRIRLPLQRHGEPGPPVSAEWLQSDSDKAESLPQRNKTIGIHHHEECSYMNSKPGSRELSSGAIKPPCVTDLIMKENANLSLEKKEHTVESLYKVLMEEWIPPSHEFDQSNSDEQEWLFDSKQESNGNKRYKLAHRDESCRASPSLRLCARHLPEADVYALPYTVPF